MTGVHRVRVSKSIKLLGSPTASRRAELINVAIFLWAAEGRRPIDIPGRIERDLAIGWLDSVETTHVIKQSLRPGAQCGVASGDRRSQGENGSCSDSTSGSCAVESAVGPEDDAAERLLTVFAPGEHVELIVDVAGPVALELINRSQTTRTAAVSRAIEIPRTIQSHAAVWIQPVRPGE